MGAVDGEFGIPAAPILIPEGPWKEIDGCVNAPKGFKAQGGHLPHPCVNLSFPCRTTIFVFVITI